MECRLIPKIDTGLSIHMTSTREPCLRRTGRGGPRLEVYGYSNEIGEADLHDFLAAVLFGPGIKISGNRPIIGRLFELINRPVCVVRTLETDEGEIVPVCSNCGEPISLTDSFCPHCSAEVVGNEFDC